MDGRRYRPAAGRSARSTAAIHGVPPPPTRNCAAADPAASHRLSRGFSRARSDSRWPAGSPVPIARNRRCRPLLRRAQLQRMGDVDRQKIARLTPGSFWKNRMPERTRRKASAPAVRGVCLVQIVSVGALGSVASVIRALFPFADNETQRRSRPIARPITPVGPPRIHQDAIWQRDGTIWRRLNRVAHDQDHAAGLCSFRAELPEVYRIQDSSGNATPSAPAAARRRRTRRGAWRDVP